MRIPSKALPNIARSEDLVRVRVRVRIRVRVRLRGRGRVRLRLRVSGGPVLLERGVDQLEHPPRLAVGGVSACHCGQVGLGLVVLADVAAGDPAPEARLDVRR